MSEQLRVGSIVEVTATECSCYGKQGQVVGFDKCSRLTPVRVWFGRDADSQIDYYLQRNLTEKYSVEPPPESEQAEDLRTSNYAERELQICSGWAIKTLAERYFRGLYHTYWEPKEAFVAGARDCDVDSCSNMTTERIVFNIWGTVCFADVCITCAPKYHRMCGESFPWKKRAINA